MINPPPANYFNIATAAGGGTAGEDTTALDITTTTN